MDNIKSNPKKVFKFIGLLQTLKIIPNIRSQNSVSFSNIDICFTSSANEGHSVRTTTRGSNGPQNVTQLTNDHPSRMKVMLQ
jgi:hypothetical protein